MNTSFSPDDPDYPPIEAMVRDQFGSIPNMRIASSDETYAFNEQISGARILSLVAYFRAGLQISDTVGQLAWWHFGSEDRAGRFLEFACGYGRSTRFFVSQFGKERVWASDLSPGAVEFQSEEIGVCSLLSASKPENFKPEMQWDCIFAGSLFSHLPAATFTRWLWKLFSLLAPGGLLIFGVHGQSTMPANAVMPRTGLYFVPTNNIPSLDTGDYGATIVTDGFVHNAILAVTGSLEYRSIPKGLCFEQDVYLICKGKLSEQPISFQFGPNGCVDFCRWTEPEQMKVTGWAVDVTPGEQVERVEVYYNGILRGTCGLNHSRPDVAIFLGLPTDPSALRCGWDCFVQLEGEKLRPEQDWMLVKAVSSSGKEFVLRLDHPANIGEFESMRGWTYSEIEGGSKAIKPVLRYIDFPPNGRFITADTSLAGWIATEEAQALEGLTLEGRFGAVPFTRVERPDVSAPLGLAALGFEAVLPAVYLSNPYPRLRLSTRSGVVLATLDTVVDLEQPI